MNKTNQLYLDDMENNWDDLDFMYQEIEGHYLDEELAMLGRGEYLEEQSDAHIF